MLPYHPEDLDYEDYVYEEYENEKDEVTKSYVKVLITNISLKIRQVNIVSILQTWNPLDSSPHFDTNN